MTDDLIFLSVTLSGIKCFHSVAGIVAFLSVPIVNALCDVLTSPGCSDTARQSAAAFSFALHVEASGSKVINSSVAIKDHVVPFNRGILKTSQETTDCLQASNNLPVRSTKKEDGEEIVQEQSNVQYIHTTRSRVYGTFIMTGFP